jgi:TolB protein
MAAPARAAVEGAIYGPGSASVPIAVVPLKDLGGDAGNALGAQFARVLSRDLELSGYFRLVDPKTFVENPPAGGLTAAETDFAGWGALGAQAVVKGGITVASGTVTAEVRMFDIPARKDVEAVGKRFTGGRADVPRMAHKTADAILEFLTGDRGPFDSQIALVSTRSGRLKDIYLWTFDRDEPVRLTDERSLMLGTRWRPDGRAVTFVSYRDHLPNLFQVDLANRQVSRVVPGPGPIFGGAWSPDGSRLLITRERAGNSDIDLLDRTGRVLKQLTDHWAIDVSPTWAPDGKRFAFCSARSGSPQIYVMDVDGDEPQRISSTGSYNTSPAWSPKGDAIAYTTRNGGDFQIVVMAPDGSGAHTVTSQGRGEDPTWAPDGRYIIYSSSRGGHRHLALTDRDGRVQNELTHGAADDTSPAWSPRGE